MERGRAPPAFPTTVINGRSLPTSSSPRAARAALSSATALGHGGGSAEIVTEGEVNHAIGSGRTRAQRSQVRQIAATRLGAGLLQGRG